MPTLLPGRRARGCVWRQLALFLCLQLSLACGSFAHAHASLIAADPSDNSVLSALPDHATLTFSEPVTPLVFRLASPAGGTQPLGRITPVDDKLHISLPPGGRSGTYALSWRVVSADGHPVGGTLLFSVGAASVVADATESTASWRPQAIWLARLALYLAMFFAVGGALFQAMTGSGHRSKLWTKQAAWLGLAAIPSGFVLQGLDALDADWRSVLSLSTWQAALDTSYAITLALAGLALIAARLSIHLSARYAQVLSASTGALLLGLAFAASGHASAAPPQWLARPAVALHVLAAALWLGALIPLWQQARSQSPSFIHSLGIFSRYISFVVMTLVATGLLLAWLQMGLFSSLWTTLYGRVLLAKLSVVVGLLLLGTWNRYRLTAAALRGEAVARRALARTIAIEILLAVCLLAIIALWRFTPPPRALNFVRPATVSMHIHDAAAMADLTLTPTSPSKPGSLELMLLDANMAPLEVLAVNVSFSNVSLGIEPIRRKAQKLGPGRWEIVALDLPRANRWTLDIDALISDFDQIELKGELQIADTPYPISAP